MATVTKSPIAIGLVLFYTFFYVSSARTSGILTKLYKKATEDNRPLIIVLEKSFGNNALTSKSKYTDYSNEKHIDLTRVHNYQPRPHTLEDNSISQLLRQLGTKTYLNKNRISKSRDRRSRLRSRLHSAKHNKSHLRSYPDEDYRTDRDRRDDRRDRLSDRLERDRRDKLKNYRGRVYQHRYNSDRYDRDRYDQDRYDRDRYDRDRYNRDRYNRDRHDRDRYDIDDREELDRQDQNKYDRYRARADGRNRARHYREFQQHRSSGKTYPKPILSRYDRDRRDKDHTNRDQVRNENSYKTYLEKNYKGSVENRKDTIQERALRNSVIKNYLRYSNDLNCDALDECAKECDNTYEPNEADDCVNECDTQFECEDTLLYQQRADFEDCDFADSCLDSVQDKGNNPSTRGILLEPDEKENGKQVDDDDCITQMTC